MNLISEYRDDNTQLMGDDTLVEISRSFEIDTERESDRYVSVEIVYGVKALNADGDVITDPNEIAELEEAWLVWFDEREDARRHARNEIGFGKNSFMCWEDDNPEPIRYLWDSCETWATKESLDDDYDNHEMYYNEVYSEKYFTNEADALEHAWRDLNSYDWERDFSF